MTEKQHSTSDPNYEFVVLDHLPVKEIKCREAACVFVQRMEEPC